ncbi:MULTISPECIES: transcription antitermination factor NusB [Chromobacterium]|jgi:N utilization substance protein B|uniref:Transcription antitermination protein NusB n=2 Tax=Chromobacterium TaxID=535 RepID=A0A1S1XCA0_9NEIS|nr:MULTISPECIES: transcription antitermination factor NusB [Chromobacterium]KIA80661.1 antitermination protein NusB [Chromobacterium piscinae]MBM2886600.1 transcription antitermination factor NusB [Chromobacterium amazonense]MDE1711896.1 transcription antitermination factor NusB [Chromobacterium amazonense]MDQ4541390.1 transcription antitermination factor NusB [Chromobacterium amazonense]OHX17642.1 N utilization substance protein B [Chromobacterium amazonense]
MKTARRRAREFAVQGIYEWELNPDRPASLIEKHLRENEYFVKADEALFRGILYGVLKDVETLSAQVSRYYERADDEVSPVERAVLLMAALELTQSPETPYPVIINEAIEITKTFGGTDGHKFVNGVLDKLAADVRGDEVLAQKQRRKQD